MPGSTAASSSLSDPGGLDTATARIAAGAPLLRVRGAGKSFAGTAALTGVDLDLRAGEMLALVGANGAGKSTLVKIICGAVMPDAGTLEVGGRTVHLRTVADALAAGIAVAHQQVAIIRQLTGAENIMLGREPLHGGLIDRRALTAAAQELADRFDVRIDLSCECDTLSLGELKILDILKALATTPRILILDEPTASLTLAETQRLFAFLADLKQRGIGILFISHHMNEVFAQCDRVVVLKDGRKVHDGDLADTTLPAVVRLMVGRTIEETDWTSHAVIGKSDDDVISIRGLRIGRLGVPDLTVRRGEVVGVAGVLGAGQTELLECLAGAARPVDPGQVRLADLGRLPRNVADAVDHGIYLVADDRLRKAIFRGLSVEENILAGSLAQISRHGFVQGRTAMASVRTIIERLRVKCSGPHQEVLQLSGGNQQKVIFGRWLARIGSGATPPVLLLDNPTEGVDVGSKAELYALISDLARQGAAILIASAEFSELITLCDRVYCITHSRTAVCVPRTELSEDRLLLEVN
ncbi:sugar ABC transporter ATP-binding protein [Lichenicola cladoniae]|uniref:Sugar ABC transporter ATP-binding protein n=1 Tax=Lichenicola cladoniae TaxID=1484109 RepID=A0A6M8HVB8_9PROT|nr:sugar ABC transporter ATP-binding protein [Lichenicola cladoniae]NPD69446.1 sugar ABC transporter ATP-binding protein [Acetobacteraceae bacterium]QKE92176.1 sugar ABC transporter ATP-binding protein [Lichenicola cladoniae]